MPGTLRRASKSGDRSTPKLNAWFNAAVSPDRRLVATGNIKKQSLGADLGEDDPAIRVWDLASGKQVAKLVGHDSMSSNLVFSPTGGGMLASVSGGFSVESDMGLRIWDIASGRQLRRFDYPAGGANAVAYLPSGRAIITSGSQGWHGHCLGRLRSAWFAGQRSA